MAQSKPLKVKIYIEGGSVGASNEDDDIDVLKRSFHTFFKRILSHPPEVDPKGFGGKTISKFSGVVRYGGVDVALLLVDSEGPAPAPDQMSFKQFLTGEGQRRKNSRLLAWADENQIFLMVQCMEAWFLADKDGLANYYRRGGNQFDPGDLPPKGQQSAEDVSCNQIQASINKALAKADKHKPKTKRRRYEKWHGFEIIAYIDPHKVAAASPHARRLFDRLIQLQQDS